MIEDRRTNRQPTGLDSQEFVRLGLANRIVALEGWLRELKSIFGTHDEESLPFDVWSAYEKSRAILDAIELPPEVK